jgi:hypothetical protein
MKIAWLHCAFAMIPLMSCASLEQRRALQSCTFTVKQFAVDSAVGDSVHVRATFAVYNPGKIPAVLDSLELFVMAPNPLARIRHGALQRIAPGDTGLISLRVGLDKTKILPTAFLWAFSPPDSLGLTGTAWTPRFFGWGTQSHPLTLQVPFQRIAPSIQTLLKQSNTSQ